MATSLGVAMKRAKIEEEREIRDKLLEPVKAAAQFASPIISAVSGMKAAKTAAQGRVDAAKIGADKAWNSRRKPNDPSYYIAPNFSLSFIDSIRTWDVKDGILPVNEVVGAVGAVEPGILLLKWKPTLGNTLPSASNGVTPAISQAMDALYATVRAANSGASNQITKSTQMLYLLECDSVITQLTQLKRYYRCLNLYNAENRYSGLVLASTMYGRDTVTEAQKDAKRLADLKATINYLIRKFNTSLKCPNLISLFNVHGVMANDVYIDSPSDRANYMLYSCLDIGYYNETDDKVHFSTLQAAHTDDIISAIELCIDSLLQSEPMNIVNGDLLKAFGDGSIAQIPEITDGEVQEFIYSEEINERINNTVVHRLAAGWDFDYKSSPDGNFIYQGGTTAPGYTEPDYYGLIGGMPNTGTNIDDKHFTNQLTTLWLATDKSNLSLTAEDILSMTRHSVMYYAYKKPNGSNYAYGFGFKALGTELIYEADVFNISTATNELTIPYNMFYSFNDSAQQSTGYYSLIARTGMFEVFPMIGLCTMTALDTASNYRIYNTNGPDKYVAYWYRGANKVPVTTSQLAQLHRFAVLGEFSLRQMGSERTLDSGAKSIGNNNRSRKPKNSNPKGKKEPEGLSPESK